MVRAISVGAALVVRAAVPSVISNGDRQAERVHHEVGCRRQAAARPTERLLRGPPFPPPESWCARLIVLSIESHAASTSALTAANSCAHFPFFDHRSKRLNTVFHGPNSLGRSRQGTPVRRHHRTASMNIRSSLGGLPTLLSESRCAATVAHCASPSCRRTMVRAHGARRGLHGKLLGERPQQTELWVGGGGSEPRAPRPESTDPEPRPRSQPTSPRRLRPPPCPTSRATT